MKLNTLINQIDTISIKGNDAIVEIIDVTFDSRKVKRGVAFVAITGEKDDGFNYIDSAIRKGSNLIISEKYPSEIIKGITYVLVKNASKSLAHISSILFQHPSRKICLIGVTGTNGKTTVVTLLHQLFINLGISAGLLSTIEDKINQETFPSTHTTGDSIHINKMLSKMVLAGCEFCFMEVSSHAIHQNRIKYLDFDGAVFTNISHEHLDYHKNFLNYINTKKLFFQELKSTAFSLINEDDKNAGVMISNSKSRKVTYSLKSMSEYRCKIKENTIDGMLLDINNDDVWVRQTGMFNAYNLLAVFSVCRELGFDKDDLLLQLSNLESAAGRFQTLKAHNNVTIIFDYAHTPDAFSNILLAVNGIKEKSARLIMLFGCGGDRDKTKRSKMTSIAVNFSDKVVLTSDNPRTEDPKKIVNDMMSELSQEMMNKVIVNLDREQALYTAMQLASNNDIILVAGKGHEKYQEIDGVKYPFDDVEIIKKKIK
ncbi:MAG: UDP-N-acetylmuramoyl-L-alanyl-D-glutamate--2,6-diaminopimelate ligase [Flavobacteriales bacterium]|nr:UDP-N-acetylmuramoyl-L-alanyl-D-glutamate--2,6-diaminopimelate ligase [Flavobacteriales bacterium]|tara:strand:- start:1751 stop:3202 length:1452 start_codon:yes stop_codon:yes gene_type:complete